MIFSQIAAMSCCHVVFVELDMYDYCNDFWSLSEAVCST